MEEIPSVIRKGGLSLVYYSLTVFLSMIISLIATRKLEPIEFGTYQFLVILASLFNLGISSLGWFLTRFIARGYDVKKEAIKIGSLLILVSDLLLFLFLIFVTNISIPMSFNLILLTVLLFFSQSLFLLFANAIQGIDVSITYLSNVIQAIARLSLLFIGIYILFEKLSVEIFIVVIFIANLLAAIFLFAKLLKFKGRHQKNVLMNTFKKFWYVPFLNSLFISMIIYDSALMTLEATAGKNPVSHTGKLYSITAQRICDKIVSECEDVKEVYCYMVSSIGHPINEPKTINLKVIPEKSGPDEATLSSIVKEELNKLPYIWKDILEKKVRLF